MSSNKTKDLLVTIERRRRELEFSGTTYEELLAAIQEEFDDVIPKDAEISHVEILKSEKTGYVELRPKKVGSLSEDSVLRGILKASVPKDKTGGRPVSQCEEDYDVGKHYCTFMEDGSDDDEDDSSEDTALAAVISRNKIWEGRKQLKVSFKNKEVLNEWRCGDQTMTSKTILAWARGAWNDSLYLQGVPKFEEVINWTEGDIRVEFTDKKGCWSMVGRDAEAKKKRTEPTMQLNLRSHSEAFQESLVIHEFGHALGLRHEHQRSDFWQAIKKHIDEKKMMNDERVRCSKAGKGASGFEMQWSKETRKKPTPYKPKKMISSYDPDSIMHYWFDVEWLIDPCLREHSNIVKAPHLTPFEKKCLKSFHEKCDEPLARGPSSSDIKLLGEAYGKVIVSTPGDRRMSDTPQAHSGPPYPGKLETRDSLADVDQTDPDKAGVNCSKLWQGVDTLSVYFMNPDHLSGWRGYKGIPMNSNTIMGWAQVWNTVFYPDIPKFVEVTGAEAADIRVKFSDTDSSWSMIGMDAGNNRDKKKPTMVLNLNGQSPDLQKSLVIHQFGHALGLGHEHQRSDFWEVMEKHLDIEKMMTDSRVNTEKSEEGKAIFGRDWFKKSDSSTHDLESEYDPMSIMHYWFDLRWLKDERLRKYENIQHMKDLSETEKKVLKGFHERYKGDMLPKAPSKLDFEKLGKAYRRVDTTS